MNEFIESRKHKEAKPVVAICYDFDKTLSPTDMQEQGFIQSIGYNVTQFWDESNSLAANNDMDQNLAYMYTMKEKAEGQVLFTRKKLVEYGQSIELFDGVKDWFGRIKKHGESQGVIVEHYIIFSGLKEMIEGTSIAGEFEKIYYNQQREQINNDKQLGAEKRERIELIIALDNSHNYATTHAVIAKLQAIPSWESEEREDLFRIAVENSQVKGVLNDKDVKTFYKLLLNSSKSLSDNAQAVKAYIKNKNNFSNNPFLHKKYLILRRFE